MAHAWVSGHDHSTYDVLTDDGHNGSAIGGHTVLEALVVMVGTDVERALWFPERLKAT